MALNKRLHESDEEEDLEILRIAALKSLKKPAALPLNTIQVTGPCLPSVCSSNTFNLSSKGSGKRGRYGNGRVARNGSYNNRVRNSNLISVPTIETDSTSQSQHKPGNKISNQAIPKLILPQDRYCGVKASTEDKAETGSKFDRYKDSDESDDSDSDQEKITDKEPSKHLERSQSLEDLLQELENEIQGVTRPLVTEKTDTKLKPKLKKIKTSETLDNKIDDTKSQAVELIPPVEEKLETLDDTQIENKNPDLVLKEPDTLCEFNPSSTKPSAQTPLQNISYDNPVVCPVLPYVPVYSQFPNPMIYNTSLPYPFPNISVPVIEPTRNVRPISPLAINTDILNTITAPLSPRSAAFVLQNREIIERRKKSPRRSYSSSPSPEFRESVSPRYRRSPKRSPKHSPVRRTSPVRNIMRRLSPKSNSRHSSPKHSGASPRKHRHTREPIKSEDETRRNLRKSPPTLESRTISPVDAVLEARRKKFEAGILVAKEGVIRLKPKESNEIAKEEQPVQDTQDIDDLLVGSDDLDLDICDTSILSDDDSDSGNEGRFKSISQESNNVSTMSYSMLLTETSQMIRKENNQSGFRSGIKNKKSYSPDLEKASNSKTRISKSLKNSLQLRIESKGRKRKPPIVSPIENKKIEIKIRNPSKYESTNTNSKDDGDDVRLVEVSNLPATVESDKQNQLSNESDDDSKDEGDLRTQLSRKRAERQNKVPISDGVQSRLIQNALQGAIFKKSHKLKKKKEVAPLDKVDGSIRGTASNSVHGVAEGSCSTDRKVKIVYSEIEQIPTASDGKLPIHLRLGIPGNSDLFEDTTVPKTSRKRNKNRGTLDQV